MTSSDGTKQEAAGGTSRRRFLRGGLLTTLGGLVSVDPFTKAAASASPSHLNSSMVREVIRVPKQLKSRITPAVRYLRAAGFQIDVPSAERVSLSFKGTPVSIVYAGTVSSKDNQRALIYAVQPQEGPAEVHAVILDMIEGVPHVVRLFGHVDGSFLEVGRLERQPDGPPRIYSVPGTPYTPDVLSQFNKVLAFTKEDLQNNAADWCPGDCRTCKDALRDAIESKGEAACDVAIGGVVCTVMCSFLTGIPIIGQIFCGIACGIVATVVCDHLLSNEDDACELCREMGQCATCA